jgi:hypothetical protein
MIYIDLTVAVFRLSSICFPFGICGERSGTDRYFCPSSSVSPSVSLYQFLFDRLCDTCKVHPITGHQGPRVEVSPYSFSTSAREAGGWSAPRCGRFTSGKDPVPIVQEAGWAPGPV